MPEEAAVVEEVEVVEVKVEEAVEVGEEAAEEKEALLKELPQQPLNS